MARKSLTIAGLLAQHAAAQGMLRFGCSQLVIERADPLVSPGMNPSPHIHQVVGGNSFNVTMETSVDPSTLSTCTSCGAAKDFSNYWTANLYFKSPENGTYKRVMQTQDFPRAAYPPDNAGVALYYMLPFGGGSSKVTAMKPGFRMLAGDSSLRTAKGSNSGICHRCLGASAGIAPCDSTDSPALPNKVCPLGIRSSIIFPSCWDGKNLDSPDHKSHVAFSPAGYGLAGASCPSTHPVRIPQVMFEIFWDTRPFNDPKYFQNGQQPFVYSTGDNTGYGQHGDYLFGWKGDALQSAMDGLAGRGGGSLEMQTLQKMMACTVKQQVQEDVGTSGWINQLPSGMALND